MSTNLPIDPAELSARLALYAVAQSSSDSSIMLQSVGSTVIRTESSERNLLIAQGYTMFRDIDSISSFSNSVTSVSPIVHEVPYDSYYFGSLVFSVIPSKTTFSEVKQFVDDCQKQDSLCKRLFPSLYSDMFRQYFLNTLKPEIYTVFSSSVRKETLQKICNDFSCSDLVYNVIFFFVEVASIVLKEEYPDLDLATMKLVLEEAAISSHLEIERHIDKSDLRNAHFQSLGLFAHKLSIRGRLCALSENIQTWDKPTKEQFCKVLNEYMQGSLRTDISQCSENMQRVFQIFCEFEENRDLKGIIYAHVVQELKD